MKSDLTIYNLLTIIRDLAYTSLVDDTPEWRVKREEALRKIKALTDQALEGEDSKEDALLWIAVYTHRYGNDVIPYFRPLDRPLTEDEVIENLYDWEGDTREDEYIDILGPFPLALEDSGALEKSSKDIRIELLEALSELVVHLELAPDWDADTLPLLIQDAGEVIEKARKELGIK